MNQSNYVEDEFFEGLLSDFLDESDQLLEKLGADLLLLEEAVREGNSRCDADLMNEMFRSAHSIKGLSAMLGLSQINSLTHNIENLFDAARRNELPLDMSIVQVIFGATDKLNEMIESLKESGEDADLAGAEKAKIAEILRVAKEAPSPRASDQQNDVPGDQELTPQTTLEPNDGQPTPAADTPTAQNPAAQNPAAQNPAAQNPAAQNPAAQNPAMTDETVTQQRPNPADFHKQADAHFEGVADEASLPTKYLTIFIDETDLSLDSLAEALLVFEESDSVETALITAHRIKGSAASIGLNRIAKLAHLMEDLLQVLREEKSGLNSELADALLLCCDEMRTFVDGLKKGEASEANFASVAATLLAADSVYQQADQKSDAVSPQVEPEAPESGAHDSETQESQATPQRDNVAPASANEQQHLAELVPAEIRTQLAATLVTSFTAGSVLFDAGLSLAGLKAALVAEKLSQFGQIVWSDPPVAGIEELDSLAAFHFAIDTEVDHSDLCLQLKIFGVESVALEQVALSNSSASTTDAAAAQTVDETSSAPQISNYENVAKLETPVNMASEPNDSSAVANENETTVSGTESKTQPAPSSAAVDATPVVAKPAAPSSVQSVENSSAKPASSSKSARAKDVAKPAETLRVDIERLDQLMNLAGQLVISKATFAQIGHSLRDQLPSKKILQALKNTSSLVERLERSQEADSTSPAMSNGVLEDHVAHLRNDLQTVTKELHGLMEMRSGVASLFDAIHQLDRVSDGIHQSVMDTRMVPVGPLFARFRRVIRDITRNNGKDIELELRGEKTELDKRMIDELGDPLIHMVRNSADHGIESPEERIAQGKPAQGRVTLEAFHRGNSIVIQVVDDGKGLDPQVILNKAIEKGIVTTADANKLTKHQIYQLIWEPGFSTAEKVTEISGRGMGMDIVRSKIEGINGLVEVDSELGVGTTFQIKLPLTLAILPSLLARVHDDVYAFPVDSVVEIVSVPNEKLRYVQSQRTAVVRDRVISVLELDEIFGCKTSDSGTREDWTLVIVGNEGTELGIAVDHLIGEEDCVIKSIAENYQNVSGIAGASILGNGRVSLILDVAALIQISRQLSSQLAS